MPDGSPLPPTSVRRQALLPAGLAPLYLSREEAAAYVGVSVDTFIAEVREGWWPEPVRRGGRCMRSLRTGRGRATRCCGPCGWC